MYDHLDVPQGIRTLADTSPGARVVVHSILGPHRHANRRTYPVAGEDLLCTDVDGDCINFERADGSRFAILRADARRIRVECFAESREAEWCAR